jgi:hypothetical protein
MPLADETSSRVCVPQRVLKVPPTRTPVRLVGKLSRRPPKLQHSLLPPLLPAVGPQKLKTISDDARLLFSCRRKPALRASKQSENSTTCRLLRISGPSIDHIGQLRVAAELLCCLGRPIHRRPPRAARLSHRDIPLCETAVEQGKERQSLRRYKPGMSFFSGIFPIQAARQMGYRLAHRVPVSTRPSTGVLRRVCPSRPAESWRGQAR